MQQGDNANTSDGGNGTGNVRRRRINRMKIGIIVLVIILFLIPTICCIVLGLKVSRMQRQMDALFSRYGQEELFDRYDPDGNYAYAAEAEEAGGSVAEGEVRYTDLSDGASGADGTDGTDVAGGTGKGNTIEADSTDRKNTYKDSIDKGSTEADNAYRENIDNGNTEADSAYRDNINKGSTDKLSIDTGSTGKDNLPAGSTDTANTAVSAQAAEEPSVPAGKYSSKKVYLTFDDGPSIYTDDILDILKEYQVKATFFVIGQTDASSKKLYKRIVDEGHTLGMHSYSHKYSKLYNSVEDFEKDFTKLWKLLYDTTGYKPTIYRFPGGSDNEVNKHGMEDFIRYLNEAGIVYYDWNVVNGDATGVTYTKEQLIDNVLDGVETKTNSIVLMHDAQDKETTVSSLPGLLDVLISEGAQILPLDKDVPPIQMIKAETVK